MEEELKCTLLLPLKEMALRTVVAHSCSDSDVLTNVLRFRKIRYPPDHGAEWKRCVEDVLKDKLSRMNLPSKLLKQAKDLVRPMALELRRGMLLHNYGVNFSVDDRLPYIPQLCWTSVGRIDYLKTAENIVRDDSTDLETRYQVACAYCFEEPIRRFWNELPEERKAYYSSRYLDMGHLDSFWARILSGDLSSMKAYLRKDGYNLTSFNQLGFEYSAENPVSGCKSAMKYYFDKLTFEEREVSLKRTAHKLLTMSSYDEDKYAEVAHYLLTLMTPAERRKAVEKHPINVLLLFLFWPLQDLFLENASVVWTFLDSSFYRLLLDKMSRIFRWSGFYWQALFRQFFIQSPPELKKYFALQLTNDVDSYTATDFFHLFLKSEDLESIEIIFENLDEEDRAKIVFDEHVQFLFFRCALNRRWHMVEACLRKATLSVQDKKRWKKGFMKTNAPAIQRWDETWEGFFKFFEAEKEKKDQK